MVRIYAIAALVAAMLALVATLSILILIVALQRLELRGSRPAPAKVDRDRAAAW